MPFTKHAEFQAYGEIEGTALTGSYQQVITGNDDVFIIFVFNSCDDTVILSFDGGITDHFKLDKRESFDIDLRTSTLLIGRPTIMAKHDGSVPSSGSIRITLLI
jgi:hypothetical protein